MDIMKIIKQTSSNPFLSTDTFNAIERKAAVYWDTGCKMLNLALSGDVNKGMGPGITQLAAAPKTFKSIFGLITANSFIKANPDGVVYMIDTEGGVNAEYLKPYKYLTEKTFKHNPCHIIEDIASDLTAFLDACKQEFVESKMKDYPKVMILFDSLGNVTSKKAYTDAVEGNDKQDMTKAKATNEMFRNITLLLNMLCIPMFVVNRTYQSQDFIPKAIVGGGQGSIFGSDSVFTITKAKSKNSSGAVDQHTFTLVPLYSRVIREGLKLPVNVYYRDAGDDRPALGEYSGLDSLAKLMNLITSASGWTYFDRGGKHEAKCKTADIDSANEFWEVVFANSNFASMLTELVSISSPVRTEQSKVVSHAVEKLEKDKLSEDEVNSLRGI